MAATTPEKTSVDSAQSSGAQVRDPSLLPETTVKAEAIAVVEGLRPPASHIEHLSLGTRLFHRVEAVAGITIAKAVFHAGKRHKIHAELDVLEKNQQTRGLTPDESAKLVPLVVKLNEHARQKDVNAALQVVTDAESGDPAKLVKSQAQQIQALDARDKAAHDVLGLTSAPATTQPATETPLPAASAPSDTRDFTVHRKGFKGSETVEAIKHVVGSFAAPATKDPFQNFVRNHGELINRQAEMDRQAVEMTPEQNQAANKRFLADAVKYWPEVDPSDRQIAIEMLGKRNVAVEQTTDQIGDLQHRVSQVEASADQVRQLSAAPKPAHHTANIYMDPTTAFTPIVPGLNSTSREK